MKLLILLVKIGMATAAFSQGYIGKTKEEVKKGLGYYVAKQKLKVEFDEYDSLITFDVRDTTRKRVDHIYVFDQSGKCHSEIIKACEECISLFLKNNLNWKKYKWVAQNDSTYFSSYAGGLKMEKLKQDTSSILIVKREPG